ncbi:histone H3-K4 methyltransferase Set1 [Wilcoxina mikolae CBS 423.85]|nr:histone H3-K4 methyltransferase Set1 [Wilcoxina mikolae CBS 423.85]
MSRAGYADFFPAAPSVLAKKAQAERVAKEKKEKAKARAHEEYDRDISGARSAGSTTSAASIPAHSNSQLTPATSSSSPPESSPRATTKAERLPPVETYKEPSRPTIPTPKATPPAAVKPEPLERNCRIKYDPALDKDSVSRKGKQPIYRYEGEGVSTPIEDPRDSHPDYTKGPKFGKKKVRVALDRARWDWDQNYIGPGPPAQILITGLSALATEHEVLMNFRPFGEIEKFELKVDPTTGGSLGVCSIIYRDNKAAKTLGHHAAKRAVQKGSSLKIAMQRVLVVLDRDGLKCTKVVNRMLEDKRRQQEDAIRKEEELAARNRPAPFCGGDMAGNNLQDSLPVRRDQSLVRDHDNRFSKPRPQVYRAIDELGRRPAVFISSKYIPGEQRFCRHLYGRLKNFGVQDILCDREGFFVVFENKRGLDNCFRMCHGDRLFSYQMHMKPYPRGNPNASKSRSPSPPPKPTRKLERVDIIKDTTDLVVKELHAALISDVRKRVADPLIYDLLDRERLAKRRKIEEPPKGDGMTVDMNLASALAGDSPGSAAIPLSVLSATAALKRLNSDGRPTQLTALPRFKKHKPKRPETPTSDASPLPNGIRGQRSGDARPLAHRLNHYDVGGSDDESTTTDHRPVSRGSASRALSTDIGDEDSASIAASLADMRNRKRKRSLGARTPSRLKDAAVSTDDEDEPGELVERSPEESHMEVDEEETPPDMNDFIEDSDEDAIVRRKKIRKSLVCEDAPEEGGHKPIEDEDETIDIMGHDENLAGSKMAVMPLNLHLDKVDVEADVTVTETPTIDLSWTISSTDCPRVTLDDNFEMIMDLDGVQTLVKDDEDLRFLRMAMKDDVASPIGNVHAWTCKVKEVKAANRDGKRGVIHTVEKIEGFYRPNPSGCARTEGYRKIPEAEKSKYLPHRLAVAAKRANAAVQVSPTAPSRTSGNKPVSSSRENRVNNRRLVQELNNQKQILSADADVMRFNQLKKRKKPVRFARSAIHNWGLYAMENISANDMIIEYVGEIVRQQVADMREKKYIKSGIGSSYLFRIDENTVIDATKKGGIARFINHSCTPNCTAKIIKVEGSKRIVIYAMRDIKENEELTYDYKFERELDSDERIPCLCGSSGCKGFLN